MSAPFGDIATARLEQGSPEWIEARAALVTGTGCSSLEAINPYASAQVWLRNAVRGLAKADSEIVVNDAMRHGTATEPEAIQWYESQTGTSVRAVGLVKHPQYPFLAASPDGLVGFEGGIEIKCPYFAKKPYSVWDAGKAHYLHQCRLVMEVCDLKWIDFVCYVKTRTGPIATIERVNRDA